MEFKKPWSFEWNGNGVPQIIDADDDVVCVISTGNLRGAYDAVKIKMLGEDIVEYFGK